LVKDTNTQTSYKFGKNDKIAGEEGGQRSEVGRAEPIDRRTQTVGGSSIPLNIKSLTGPAFPVEASVLNGFGEMFRFYVSGFG
jgi:hypothetical protein